jgi:PAS domain-containing protein
LIVDDDFGGNRIHHLTLDAIASTDAGSAQPPTGVTLIGVPAGFQINFPAASQADPTNSNFRQTIERLGAQAAIITFARTRPIVRRHAYFIGFDQHAERPEKAAALLAMTEKCWAAAHDRSSLIIETHELGQFLDADTIISELETFGHLAFSTYHAGPDGCLRIALFRQASNGPFDASLNFSLSLVQPILAEIADAQINAQRAQRRIGIMEGMLDTVSHGVILLDAKARPFYLNDVARNLMTETGVVQLGNDHVLRGRTQELTHQLHEALQHALHHRAGSEELIVKLTTKDGSQMLGFLMPAHGRDNDPENRAVILMIHQMKIHAASPALMKAFGLLPSEQRFLATFLDAPSLHETALRLSLSEETSRTYLKRVCGKLGVRRQVELASLMFGLAPPIRRHAQVPLTPVM